MNRCFRFLGWESSLSHDDLIHATARFEVMTVHHHTSHLHLAEHGIDLYIWVTSVPRNHLPYPLHTLYINIWTYVVVMYCFCYVYSPGSSLYTSMWRVLLCDSNKLSRSLGWWKIRANFSYFLFSCECLVWLTCKYTMYVNEIESKHYL